MSNIVKVYYWVRDDDWVYQSSEMDKANVVRIAANVNANTFSLSGYPEFAPVVIQVLKLIFENGDPDNNPEFINDMPPIQVSTDGQLLMKRIIDTLPDPFIVCHTSYNWDTIEELEEKGCITTKSVVVTNEETNNPINMTGYLLMSATKRGHNVQFTSITGS